MSERLQCVPISFAEANEFVRRNHRHHKPVQGHKFSIAASLGGKIVGVIMVGRPVSRHRDNGTTLEVTRLCTDGTPNACSFLYGKATKAAFALGYKKVGTYILASESGVSLRAAGWRLIGTAGGGSWNSKTRPRIDTHPLEQKKLYEVVEGGWFDD